MKVKNKSAEYWWCQFQRIAKAQQSFDSNSAEYIKLNKVAWEIIGKYIDSLLEEW